MYGTIPFDSSILMFSFKLYLYGWNCQSGQGTGAGSRLRGWHSKCWVFLYKNWDQRPFHVRYQTKICPCTAYQYMPTWHCHFYLVVATVNFHFIVVFNEIVFAKDCTQNNKPVAWDDTLIYEFNSDIFAMVTFRIDFFIKSSIPYPQKYYIIFIVWMYNLEP